MELYNVDFERSILSSLIFDSSTLSQCRSNGLTKESFFISFHQKVFQTINYLFDNSIVSEDFIKESMGKDFDEKQMLNILITNPLANIEFHIQKLKNLQKLRVADQLAAQVRGIIQTDASFDNVLQTLNDGILALESDVNSLLNIKYLDEIESKESEFICKNWLPFPKKAVSILSANGGVGKSFLMMQAALRIIQDDNLKVFMWLSEDPVELSKFRFEMIVNKVLNSNPNKFKSQLQIAGSDSQTIHFLQDEKGKLVINGLFYQFKAMLREYDVIILDPLIALFGGDENNNAHAKMFINLFARWATLENKTIIFIHHGSKNSSQSRGASAFVDAARLVYQMDMIFNDKKEQIEDHMRLITIAKDNNGAKKYLGSTTIKRAVFPQPNKTPISISYDPSSMSFS
ncbi:MAG: AAA family ATPase [Campylobacterales bacterium]|nr:AAA family ATPase [Campylobacterota bacterium]MBD3842896.1 AAA family ATPase [Campylobacterales bacterium]